MAIKIRVKSILSLLFPKIIRIRKGLQSNSIVNTIFMNQYFDLIVTITFQSHLEVALFSSSTKSRILKVDIFFTSPIPLLISSSCVKSSLF